MTGFGVNRNFKKVTRQTSLAMDGDSSDDEEGSSTERYQSDFQKCNEPLKACLRMRDQDLVMTLQTLTTG